MNKGLAYVNCVFEIFTCATAKRKERRKAQGKTRKEDIKYSLRSKDAIMSNELSWFAHIGQSRTKMENLDT